MAKYFQFNKDNLVYRKYAYNNSPAIEIISDDGEPLATATICIPGLHLEHDEVLIKNYSENEGLLEDLIEMGIVEDTGKRYKSGFVEVPLCKLLINPE